MTDTAAAALAPVETDGAGDNGTGATTATDQATSQPTTQANPPATADTPSWTGGLDEDSLAYVQNKGWERPDQMLESYRNLEKFAGGSKNLVEIPGVDADPEVMSQFYDRLGRPESPDQYGFEVPEGADEELTNWFAETAHKYGLSQKQAQAIYNEWNEMSNSRMEMMESQMREQADADITSLKKEWGSDFDKNLNAGRLAANNLGYDQDSLAELESKMGTGEMLKLFANLGSKMGEDSFVSGSDNPGGFGASPAQAKAEIESLRTDTQFMDAYLSGDKAAVSKMKRLMEKAHG